MVSSNYLNNATLTFLRDTVVLSYDILSTIGPGLFGELHLVQYTDRCVSSTVRVYSVISYENTVQKYFGA